MEKPYIGLKIKGYVSITPDVNELVRKADMENIDTVWHRYQYQQPQCGFGLTGVCCRHCNTGPCRVDPFGYGFPTGTCGATPDLIASRDLLDLVAHGAATRLQEALIMINTAKHVAEGKTKEYSLKNPKRLYEIAETLGLKAENETALLKVFAETLEKEINRITDEPLLTALKLVPEDVVEKWKSNDLLPRGFARELFEANYRSNMGTDSDPISVVKQSIRIAILDGLLATFTTTVMDEILLGDKTPGKGKSGLGIIKPENVNIFIRVMPVFAGKIKAASQDPELVELAKKAGAKGISVIIPSGNMIMQELPIITGLVDVMVVDHQCIYPYITEIAKKFHTKIVIVDPVAKLPGAIHMPMNPMNASQVAKEIIKLAIENYANRRKEKIYKPIHVSEFTTNPTINGLKQAFGGSLKPIADAIREKQLLGIVVMHHCTNPKVKHNYGHYTIAKTLIENNVLVFSMGCSMMAMALTGLAKPEALELAGSGLKNFLAKYNLPPVIPLGPCVENTRELLILYEVNRELKTPFTKAPFAASAPEWMNGKAFSAALYYLAHGMLSHVGTVPQILAAPGVEKFLTEDMEKITGGKLVIEPDPREAAEIILKYLEERKI